MPKQLYSLVEKWVKRYSWQHHSLHRFYRIACCTSNGIQCTDFTILLILQPVPPTALISRHRGVVKMRCRKTGFADEIDQKMEINWIRVYPFSVQSFSCSKGHQSWNRRPTYCSHRPNCIMRADMVRAKSIQNPGKNRCSKHRYHCSRYDTNVVSWFTHAVSQTWSFRAACTLKGYKAVCAWC